MPYQLQATQIDFVHQGETSAPKIKKPYMKKG
jgi:hypothetical protein